VTIQYQAAANGMTTQRDVDPYALAYREQAWLLVGWCHLRLEVRSFRVDRMQSVVMAPKPKSPDFDRPDGFDVKAYVHRSPWTFTTEPIELVELELHPEAAEVVNEDFGADATRIVEGDTTLVAFKCGNPDFAVSRILAAKGAIVVRKGDRLRQRVADEMAAIADRYA
jgi:predicted DNA-binding transcriptional regulator YafY